MKSMPIQPNPRCGWDSACPNPATHLVLEYLEYEAPLYACAHHLEVAEAWYSKFREMSDEELEKFVSDIPK